MEIKTFWETITFGLFAMGMVFLVLALIGFVISLFKVFFYREGKSKGEGVKIEEKEILEPEVVASEKGKAKIKYAAIVAAITAYLSKKETYAVSTTAISSEVNTWKFKNLFTQRKSTIKERRWKNV